MASPLNAETPVDKCPECGGQLFRNYESKEVVCRNCGIVTTKFEDSEGAVSKPMRLPPTEHIRTARTADLALSSETKEFIRQSSQKTCVRCHRLYTPTGHRQKYCPECRENREVESLRPYKAKKARITARLKSKRRLRNKIIAQLKGTDATIASLESELRNTHAWQFMLTMKAVRSYTSKVRQLAKLKQQARQLARKLRAIEIEPTRKKRDKT